MTQTFPCTHLSQTNRHLLSLWVLVLTLLLPAMAQPSDHGKMLPVSEKRSASSIESDTPNATDIAPPQTEQATLPHNLSPWGMFMGADWVVKAVMIGLAIASLLTWTVLVSKSIELRALKRLLRSDLSQLSTVGSLKDAANSSSISDAGRELINAAETELNLSANLVSQEAGKDGIKERVVSSLSRIEAASARAMLTGTGLLATIGAVAPFVGLFGTVWGIMNSFIGISQAKTTNLAVVAPGIAEALLATALGLIAAIPAVVIYNHFARAIAAHRAVVADSAAALLRIISRDLSRGTLDAGSV